MSFNFVQPFGFICRFPPLASPQLLALMLFQCPNFSCTPVPLSNFLHAFGFNISASPGSQQLLAPIWFQYLTSPHGPLIKLPKLPAFIGFQYLCSPGSSAPLPVTHSVSHLLPILPSSSHFYSSHLFRPFSCAGAQLDVNLCGRAPLGGIHLVSISKLPPVVPLSNFLHLVSRLPLWPLNNILHAFQLGFNL